MTKTAIRWTTREKQQIVECAHKYIEAGATHLQAIRRADVEAIEPSRRRGVNQVLVMQMFPWFEDHYAAFLRSKKVQELTVKPVAQDAQPAPTLPTLSSASTLDLVEALMTKVADRITANVVTQLISALSSMTKPVETIAPQPTPVSMFDHIPSAFPPKVDKPKNKRVMIVGLHQDQYDIISKHAGAMPIDLVFKSVDANQKQLPDCAKNCDIIILMIKYMSHKTANTLKSTGVTLVQVNGGLTELKNVLNGINSGAIKP